MVNFNTLRQSCRFSSTHQLVFKAFPSMPNGMKTGLVAMLFLLCFSRSSLIAQCPIAYASPTSFNLELDPTVGEAYLTPAVFYPTYIASTNSQCNPPVGTLEIWEDAAATVAYGMTMPYPFTCTNVGFSYSVWVTLDDPGPGGPSTPIMFTITITDNDPPLLLTPGSLTLIAEMGLCVNDTTLQAFAADNCPGNLDLSYTLSGATGPLGPIPGFIANVAFNVGTTYITWIADDGINPPYTETDQIVVTDTQEPVLNPGASPDATVYTPSSSCTQNFFWTTPTISDNCGFSPYTITLNLTGAFIGGPYPLVPNTNYNAFGLLGFNLPEGTTTFSYLITDVNGLTDADVFLVTVLDTFPPVFNPGAPTNVTISPTNPSCYANANINVGPVTDNCGVASVTYAVTGDTTFSGSGSSLVHAFGTGDYTITFTATDVNGEVSIHIVQLNVEDLSPPTAACLTTYTLNLDGNGQAVLYGIDIDNGSTDNCDLNYELLREMPSYPFPYNPGYKDTLQFSCAHIAGAADVVRLRVVDDNGNIAVCTTSTTIVVQDVTIPDAECQNITRVLDGSGMTAAITPLDVNFNSTDNCTNPLTDFLIRKGTSLSEPFPIGNITFDCSEIGDNTVTLRVADAYGNVNYCQATVTVQDNTAPTPACSPLTICLDENGLASVNGLRARTYNSTGSVTILQPPPTPDMVSSVINVPDAGTIADVNISMIITQNLVGDLRAMLTHPNTTDTITLFFRPGVPSSTFGCTQDNLNVRFDDESFNTALDFETACNPNPPAIQGTFQPIRPLSTFDGLSMTGNWTLTIFDYNNINIPFTAGTLVSWSLKITDTGATNLAVLGAGSTDNCPANVSWSASPSSFNCSNIGTNVYTLTVTDGYNQATCTQTITIVDDIGPDAICQNITVNLNSAGTVTVPGASVNGGSMDNNGTCPLTFGLSPNTFDCDDLGGNGVTLTVTDPGGNTSTCNATVTVQDITPPVAACQPLSIALQPDGMVTTFAIQSSIASFDVCDGFFLTSLMSVDEDGDGDYDSPYLPSYTFDCDDIRTNEVSIQVYDDSGNFATCETTIDIQDNEDPTLICPPDLYLEWVTGMSLDAVDINSVVVIDPATPGAFDGLADDNCFVEVDSADVYQYVNCLPPGPPYYGAGYVFHIERTWSVTDSSGNTTTCLQTIYVDDTTPPIFSAPADTVLDCPDAYSVASFECNTWSNTLGFPISDVGTPSDTSHIVIGAQGLITDINVRNLRVDHTAVGDLEIWLTSPDGTPVLLYDNSCTPPTDNNIDIDFDSDDLDVYGSFPCPPIDGSAYQPFGDLNDFYGKQIQGTWVLTVHDQLNGFGGELQEWSLEICYVTPGDTTSSGGVVATDACDTIPVESFVDYHAYKDFIDHTEGGAYQFGHSNWLYYNDGGSLNFALPDSISITSSDDGDCNPFTYPSSDDHYDVAIPAGGPGPRYIAFDWRYQTSDIPLYDPFGFTINASFTQLSDDNGSNLQMQRALIPVPAGAFTFGFSQRSMDQTCGEATTTISNFVFIDGGFPVPLDCPHEFCVARIWQANDGCQNFAAQQLQIIGTQDTTPPLFANGPASTINETTDPNLCTSAVTIMRPAADGGCGDVTVTHDGPFGSGINASGNYPPGTHFITFTAEDECGLTSTHEVTLIVEDDQFPVAICQPFVNINLGSASSVTLPAASVSLGSFDNCPGLTLSVAPNTFTMPGQYPVTLSVTDADGNTSACPSLVNVLSGPNVIFDAGDASGNAGAIVTFPVTVTNFTNVGGFSFTLTMANPAVASFVSIPGASILPALNSAGIFTSSVTPTTINVAWVSSPPAGINIAPDGTIIFNVDVQIAVGASIGQTSAVTVTSTAAVNGSGGSIPSLGVPGTINVTNAGLQIPVAGLITDCDGSGVANAAINVTGTTSTPASPTSNGSGAYNFTVAQGSNPTITPLKNVNWNSGVTAADVSATLGHFVGSALFNSPFKLIAADANADDTLNIVDIFAISQIALNNPVPGNTSWRFVNPTGFTPPAITLTNRLSIPNFQNFRNYVNAQMPGISNADFVGVKTGDVNCSSTGSPFTGNGTQTDGGSGVLPFRAANVSAKEGEELVVVFKAQDFVDMAAYQFTINFDKNRLQFKEVVPLNLQNLTQQSFNVSPANEGMLATLWFTFGSLTLEDGHELFAIKFTALDDISSVSNYVSFSADYIPALAVKSNQEEIPVDLVFEGVTATGEKLEDNKFALLQNRPNPFGQETIIGFMLPEGSNATLTVMDASGRVLKVMEGDYPAGLSQVKVSRNELPASGVVFYRLETPKHSAVKKMVILE